MKINHQSLKKKALVKTITIDNFVEQHQIKFIDVLKTDTEGFELEVLKGATNAIKKILKLGCYF